MTIAESTRLQAMLATYGIQTQTPNEIEPVQIWSQWDMVKIYERLGHNDKLGLDGRPSRPIGSLGSSKIYRMCGHTVICYPLIFSASDFYLSHDMALLTDDIKSELKFVSRCWRLRGRPTVCILVTESHMKDPQFPVLLSFLSELRAGEIDGVKIRLGRLQNLISSSCVEHLDFLHHSEKEILFEGECFRQLENGHIGYQTLTDIPVIRPVQHECRDITAEFEHKNSHDIAMSITDSTDLYKSIQMLGILLKRDGGEYRIGDLTVTQRLEMLNRKAGASRHWAAVRYSSSLLKQMVDSISPFVTQILVNGKHVTVGTIGVEYSLFDKPMTPAEIHEAIYTKVQPFNVISAVLQQELILYCGKLIATNPEVFSGILKVRIGWILHGLERYRLMKQDDPKPLESCSPSEIRHLLHKVLRESKTLQLSYADDVDEDDVDNVDLSVAQVRILNGCLTRVPEKFYPDLWMVLSRSPNGIWIDKQHLPHQPPLTEMTRHELSFAHKVENMWSDLKDPAYRHLVIELFCVLAAVLKRNPELRYRGKLCSDRLIAEAVDMFKKDENITEDGLSAFCEASVSTTSGYLARAALNNILTGSIVTQENRHSTDFNCPVQ